MKVTITLTKRQAEALLLSGGFATWGYRARPSKVLLEADRRVLDAIQAEYNVSLEEPHSDVQMNAPRSSAQDGASR